MPLAVILSLCMGGIACLTPLTLYLFWLSAVNRRDRPTVISGVWDFVGLLAGLSGFILSGSGLFLAAVVARSRLWGGHTFEELRDSWGRERLTWAIALAVYLAAFALLVGLSLAARRRTLVAYNTDLSTAEAAVAAVLEEVGIPVKRFGNLWSNPDGRPIVEVVPFHQFRHVSIRFLDTDPRVCEELDRRLRAALAARPAAADNPLAPWLSTAAVSAFVTVLCCALLIGAAVFFPKP